MIIKDGNVLTKNIACDKCDLEHNIFYMEKMEEGTNGWINGYLIDRKPTYYCPSCAYYYQAEKSRR